MEQLDLTTPVTKPNIISWRIVAFFGHPGETPKWIRFRLLASNGETKEITYDGTPGPVSGKTGATVMSDMNSMDFRVNSMQKRLLQLFVQDGYLGAGTVTGTPD